MGRMPREALFEPLLFPEAEYRERVRRAQELMSEQKLGALLVTDDRNGFYFGGFGGGYPDSGRTRPRFLVIPRAGEPVWLIHESAHAAVREMTWVADVRAYAPIDAVPVDHVARLLVAVGGGRTIGAELGGEERLGLSHLDFERLREAASAGSRPVRFVDASQILWRLRAIKTPAELRRLRRAATITTNAYRRAFGKVRLGMTEREVGAVFARALVAEGAHTTWHDVLTGDYSRPNGTSRTRRLEPGEMVWVDMGASWAGYWSDFSRAGVVGGPTPAQVEKQRRVVEATAAGVSAIRPGVELREVASVLDRACAGLGVTMNRRPGRYGHGLGLHVTESPHLASHDATRIEQGMVLTVEPAMSDEDGMYHCEENVVVTATGAEILSDCPRDLAVL